MYCYWNNFSNLFRSKNKSRRGVKNNLFIPYGFIFYKSDDPDKQAGQKLLAKLMMGKNFQKVFNLYKGSIPARLDVSMDEFDKCAKTSNADIKTAGASGGLVPSFAHGMAQGNTMKAALQDIITEHFNSDMSSVDAANALADSVLANM